MGLSERQTRELRKFAYKGSDASLVYKFFLSPLAQWLVDALIPTWMAPNVITLIGLLFNIASAALVIVFNPELSGVCPHVGWLALVSAACMFLYQTFDNMDGKQARKTGTSSPLGLLFDHGCDAINAGLSVLPVASALGFGWSRKMLFNVIPFIPFYFQNWEVFYRKEFVLPVINGPSDGLLLAISMMLTTFFTGSAQWFHTPYSLPLPLPPPLSSVKLVPYNVMTTLAVTGAVLTAIFQTGNVLARLAKDHQKDGGHYSSRVATAFLGLVPFVVYFASILVWLGSAHSKALTPEYRYWTLALVSSVLVEMLNHINIMYITAEPSLRPWERYTVLCTVHLAISVQPWFRRFVVAAAPMSIVGEESVLVFFSLICTYVCLRAMYDMNMEVAQALGINVFTLGASSPHRNKDKTKKTRENAMGARAASRSRKTKLQ